MSLISVSDVMRWVPQATEREELVAEVIGMAQARAEAYCKRKLELSQYTDYIDVTSDEDWLLLSNYPVVVSNDKPVVVTLDPDGSKQVLGSNAYDIDTLGGMIIRVDGYNWPVGQRAVKVEYYAGYTSDTCPVDIKQALLQIASWILESRGVVGVSDQSVGGITTRYEPVVNGLPVSVGSLLDPYRAVTIR